MIKQHEFLVKSIEKKFPDLITEVIDFRGERTIVIPQKSLKELALFLRDQEELSYNFLSDICADDLTPESPRFAVNYHIFSLPFNHQIRIRVYVEDPEDGPESLEPIWIIANWLEMEVWDLMGIRFKNHEGLRRLFLPDDWQGHPLRKDYPLGYEEVQFTFNREEIDAKKPYAKD